ncbi:MAG TPA: ADP-ribosylation factor-like protein [Polyangiaceae bacterium]|nr:ADP-ribosylation factor-like protein [Polyangiaceae bacterium]
MAVYDPDSKKLVVRVVYDGPGMAGKTTNLQQICTLFPPQRRSELYSGQTVAERTLCLDWMQIDGGLVRGHDLRCHLLTVPGQAVLSRRRQMILTLADTVVFVLESTEHGLKQAQTKWRSLFACTGGPSVVPIVVQANKQDAPGALSAAEIRERWKLDANIPVVSANASTGHGVRETVVLAIRAAAVSLQDTLATTELGALEGTYESGQDLEQRILAFERTNPMSATEVVLAARRASATPKSMRAVALPSSGEKPASSAPGAAAPVAADTALARDAAAPPTLPPELDQPSLEATPPQATPAAATSPAPSPPAANLPPADASLLVDGTPPLADSVARGPLDAPPAQPPAPSDGEPPLPSPDVPTGFIWPALEGRKTLKRIPLGEAVRHMVAHSARPPARAKDDADTIVFEAGIWCLKTNRKRRFSSADLAREELLRLAHTKLDLGTLCAPRTVLAVQRDAEDAHWLWSISVWLTTLENELEKAMSAGDDTALASALGHFARATLQALRICLASNIVLDVHPRNFGLLADEVFYLDDDVESGQTLPRVGHTILRRFDEYSRCPAALSHYREVLERGLTNDFTWRELEHLDLLRALGGTIVSTEAGRRGRAELAHAISSLRASVT